MRRNDSGRHMLAEIHDQPRTLEEVRLRLGADLREPVSDVLRAPRLRKLTGAVVVGSGSSFHAALLTRHYLESLAGLPTRVRFASEAFRHEEAGAERLLAVAFSHSGRSVDVRNAVRRARSRGIATLGLTNLDGSPLTREADAALVTGAGVEKAIPSTKGFCALGAAGLLLSSRIAEARGAKGALLRGERLVSKAAGALHRWLDEAAELDDVVTVVSEAKTAVFLGAGALYPVACDGALKLLEVAYLPALVYPPEEFLHGPLALVEPRVSVVALDGSRRDVEAILDQAKSAGASVFTIGSSPSSSIRLPKLPALAAPLLAAAPLQRLAHDVGARLGRAVDEPRHLKKVVG